MSERMFSEKNVSDIICDIVMDRAQAERKLEKIGQIVKQVESLHPEVAIGDREGIRKIKEVLEQEYIYYTEVHE